LLLQAKAVTAEQLEEALAAQSEPVSDKKLGRLLIERGWITEAQLTQTLSLQLSVPWVSLYHIDFSRQLLSRVDRGVAERYCLIPIFVRHVKGQGETLYVAMDDPTNDEALQEVSRQANLPARPMIASGNDIRSAIRVYYGEPEATSVDLPAPPPARVDPPTTTREGPPPVPAAAGASATAGAEAQRPPRPGSQPARPASKPPAARRPSAPRFPPPGATAEAAGEPPPTRRSSPPPAGVAAAPPARDDAPPLARAELAEPRRRSRMLSLTLLDGTTISLPSNKAAGASELTARDYVSALRATAHGADASEILGEESRWEPVVAALISILLKKGLIADWEFIEELRKS
jgi:type IV pilus assembly protein PilB